MYSYRDGHESIEASGRNMLWAGLEKKRGSGEVAMRQKYQVDRSRVYKGA